MSEGYSEDDQLTTISRPHLLNVTKVLRWPVALAVKSGVELILRDNTDKASPLAIEHFSSGYNVPILGNASGPCILAYLSLIEQRDVLNVLHDTGRLVRSNQTIGRGNNKVAKNNKKTGLFYTQTGEK